MSRANLDHPQRFHRKNVNLSPDPASYYFYMAANGRHVFLHPLDIRILLAKFNKYSQFPPEIDILVEAFVESSVNGDLRKRCKYLGHLPEGSDVVFVEANLENIVGKEALQPFEVALRLRRNKHLEKERKEERARIRGEELARQRERADGNWRDIDRVELSNAVTGLADNEVDPTSATPSQVVEGAWGNRSFATAANSSQSGGETRSERQRARRDEDAGDFDFDLAWQELEERAVQRKGRGKHLVVLGGAGGRRRR
jgi:hypothetical protein